MIIATWNINGVKARLDTTLSWLKKAQPDVACLQEIKSVDEAFPREPFEALGYNVITHGQKGFNGVAIFSKRPIEEWRSGLPGDESDEQARFIEAVIATDDRPVRVISLYLPNGNPVDSEKYPYKLKWMERLADYAAELLPLEEPLIFAGDYNIIPTDQDVHDAEAWRGDALILPESRAAFRKLTCLGLTEALAATTDEPGQYTFWDYQAGAWQKNHGIRIDHFLLSPQAADLMESVWIDKEVRAWEKPSDHVPVFLKLAG